MSTFARLAITSLLFATTLNVCGPYHESEHGALLSASEREINATVVIIGDGRRPCCAGVSVYDDAGMIVIDTAAHCVLHQIDEFDPAPMAEREAVIGDTVQYVTRHDWFTRGSKASNAKLAFYDDVRDQAVLIPYDNARLVPLPRLRACDRCQLDSVQIHAISSIYDWTRHDGKVTGMTYAGYNSRFYESDMSIDKGWSGSPVLNEYGQVIGLVSRCNVKQGDIACSGGWSLFTSVP